MLLFWNTQISFRFLFDDTSTLWYEIDKKKKPNLGYNSIYAVLSMIKISFNLKKIVFEGTVT